MVTKLGREDKVWLELDIPYRLVNIWIGGCEGAEIVVAEPVKLDYKSLDKSAALGKPTLALDFDMAYELLKALGKAFDVKINESTQEETNDAEFLKAPQDMTVRYT